MAIGTNALVDFFGTQDDLTNSTSAVSDGAFSDGTNDLTAWTNDDDVREAEIVIRWQYPSGTIATNPYLNVYGALQNIDSTNDTPVPDSSFKHTFLARVPCDTGVAALTNQYNRARIKLPNAQTSQVYHFYVENQTDVQMSAGWTFKITPLTGGPHA